MIDLKKTYKTAQGDKARGLHVCFQAWEGSALPIELIKGEINVRDLEQGGRKVWVEEKWNMYGVHVRARSLDLCLIPEPEVPQVDLFRL